MLDNYQEQPVRAVSHRTSPTNIGLSLLAILTAYDFGFIPMDELIGRTEKTLTTMGQLKRYRGHFYNWYDTITLEPLLPRYVSTVDSGNLVGDLLVLRQGLYELPNSPVFSRRFGEGLSDTLTLLSDAMDSATKKYKWKVPTSIQSKIEEMKEVAARMPGPVIETLRHLSYLDGTASEILVELSTHQDDEVRWWIAAVKRQIETHGNYFKSFTSWEFAGSPPDTILDEVSGGIGFVSLSGL